MAQAESTFDSQAIHGTIRPLINNLVNIKDDNGGFVTQLPDGRYIDTKSWDGWDWTHGIGLYGIWKYYELTGEVFLLVIVEDWFNNHFAVGETSKNINTMAVFLTLACLYEKTGNEAYVPRLHAWAEWAMHDLERTEHGGFQHVTYHDRNRQQLWDDTLMMTVLPLAKIGKLLHREEYILEAKKQFLLHVQYLFDAETGLFFHGWTFEDGGHNFARARWARGNAWLTMAIPEFVELLDLPACDPLRIHLLDTLEAQCRALKRLQDASGLWHTLLDHDDEGSYLEASATAGFASGMLRACRKGYLGEEYADTAELAVRAILENVDQDGELRNTSFGTAMGSHLDFYRAVPKTSMPYGQAMAIMALVEYLCR